MRQKMQRALLMHCFFTFSNLAMPNNIKHSKDWANIMVRFTTPLISDSVKMAIYDNWFPKKFPSRIEVAAKEKNGDVIFKLNSIAKPVYFSLFKEYSGTGYPRYFMPLYLLEPGDSVTIHVAEEISGSSLPRYIFKFSGKGAAKYNCRHEIDFAIFPIRRVTDKVIDDSGNLVSKNHFSGAETIINEIANKYRASMSDISYNILKIDLLSELESKRQEHLYSRHQKMLDDSVVYKNFLQQYTHKTQLLEKSFSDSAKLISRGYPQFILDKHSIGKYKGISNRVLESKFIEEMYDIIKKGYEGEVRDRVLTYFLLYHIRSKLAQALIEDALVTVKSPYCLEELRSIARFTLEGSVAHNFSLPDTSGKIASLSDFKGKVVFLDFWFKQCTGCALYYTRVIAKAEEKFLNDSNVVFISINVDKERKKWIEGIRSGRYTGQKSINLNTVGLGSDHPMIRNYRVFSYPYPLLVDKNGKIYSNNYDNLRTAREMGLIQEIQNALKKN